MVLYTQEDLLIMLDPRFLFNNEFICITIFGILNNYKDHISIFQTRTDLFYYKL